MKVLVTGAGGQLGRALLASAPPAISATGLDSARLDISDAAAVAHAVAETAPDAIINAAAYTAVDRAESEEDRALAVNGTAVAHLREAAAMHGARLVQISTDFVFDGNATRPYRPADPVAPLNVYGRTKLAGEREALAASDALVLRTSWVHAAQGHNFVRTMLRLMQERDELKVVFDQIGRPTWATSLADAVWQLLGGGASGIWHYSDAGEASWHEFALAIQQEALALGLIDRTIPIHPIATCEYPTPARRPTYGVLDTCATEGLLGRPIPHWRDNLRLMLQELKTHG